MAPRSGKRLQRKTADGIRTYGSLLMTVARRCRGASLDGIAADLEQAAHLCDKAAKRLDFHLEQFEDGTLIYAQR